MPAERLQKILAAAGHGSRRACEELIAAGRVRVNGKVATLGESADAAVDRIMLDGEPVQAEKLVYVMLYKPRGAVSSLEPQGDRPTVRDLATLPGRLYPVGRLDAMSEGLILLTNDGELTNLLTHPRFGHEKEYRVLIRGRIDQGRLEAWQRGVVIRDEDGNAERTAPAQVEVSGRDKQGAGSWLRVIMHEGKKHQIRRVAETLGLTVTRIIRIRLGPLTLDRLKSGEWRHLTKAEVSSLANATGTKSKQSQRAPTVRTKAVGAKPKQERRGRAEHSKVGGPKSKLGRRGPAPKNKTRPTGPNRSRSRRK